MKILLIFDQGLAGAGGKSNPNQDLAIAKGGIGSALMLKPHFDQVSANIVATLYCGNEYFLNHKKEVVIKMTKMAEKIQPDMVVCGPCFNFEDYALMSAEIAKSIKENTNLNVVAMMSQENESTIEAYKDKIDILKMPKKGGTGLSESFDNLACYIDSKVNGKQINEDHLY
ncbi:GrdB-related putative oxidoreductase [Anaerococcus degeneri]|uniref:Glycine/betaine/sarcosine/D-proline family reductase selenoprotein B n=1 Tax=Anaerococcus degeneri TaxID=361500 RepID=A0ABS7Z0X6_9FIRM|nr:GrdB-related putative oxidoreductase [Anaerococcus degeneri]MBP2016089.1 glycine reductase [Anaerococcus degeneri]MCA2096416.1 glycine/betaine/sarcosine/D-proline family reductase selenoprotein B [Anaerococcus degeneri]